MMSFSRLLDFAAKSLSGPSIGPRNELFVNMSDQSKMIRKVYSNNRALTFFDSLPGPEFYHFNNAGMIKKRLIADNKLAWGMPVVRGCVPSVRVGHRHYLEHDSWHHTEEDFAENHYHFLKHDDFSLEEVKCLVESIQRMQQGLSLCKDGKTECLLTDEDAEKINKQYAAVSQSYEADREAHEIKRREILETLTDFWLSGVNGYIFSFVTTLLEKYVRPSLIDRGMSAQYAEIATDTLKRINTIIFTLSVNSMVLDMVMQYLCKPLLVKVGMSDDQYESIVSNIQRAVICASNPLSMINMAIAGSTSLLGQQSAYAVIHSLPKLRQEPQPVFVMGDDASVVSAPAPGLRQRC